MHAHRYVGTDRGFIDIYDASPTYLDGRSCFRFPWLSRRDGPHAYTTRRKRASSQLARFNRTPTTGVAAARARRVSDHGGLPARALVHDPDVTRAAHAHELLDGGTRHRDLLTANGTSVDKPRVLLPQTYEERFQDTFGTNVEVATWSQESSLSTAGAPCRFAAGLALGFCGSASRRP